MDKRILAVDGVNLAGLLFVVLGLVNCVVAPLFTMEEIFKQLYPESAHVVLYNVMGTGIATAFCGSLLMYASRHMRTAQWWAWRIAWRVTWFLLILGAGGIVAMWQNPFAEILAVLDLILLFVLIKSQAVLKGNALKEWPK